MSRETDEQTTNLLSQILEFADSLELCQSDDDHIFHALIRYENFDGKYFLVVTECMQDASLGGLVERLFALVQKQKEMREKL